MWSPQGRRRIQGAGRAHEASVAKSCGPETQAASNDVAEPCHATRSNRSQSTYRRKSSASNLQLKSNRRRVPRPRGRIGRANSEHGFGGPRGRAAQRAPAAVTRLHPTGGTKPDTGIPIGDRHMVIGDTNMPIGDTGMPIGDTRRVIGDIPTPSRRAPGEPSPALPCRCRKKTKPSQ